VVGPQVSLVDLEIPPDHRAVMIGFQPGGLFRFLGIPMTEIFDDGYNGFDILDKDIHSLIQHLHEVHEPLRVNALVQQYLMKKLHLIPEILPFDKAIPGLLKMGNDSRIGDVAGDACLSLRQFERRCRERLGVSPKLFTRLARFSRAYRMFEGNPGLTWTQISYHCGYFDQMHLIRDFKQFAGVAPGALQARLLKNGFRFQAPLDAVMGPP
jgi:AraC-like DNA-binding protein